MDRTLAWFYTPRVNSDSDLLTPLRRYWGYNAFRPMQERIVRSLLDGRDTCVVMPTGGGKSLCYQLPAAMSPRKTVIVVSPLIALMQDQVAQLGQMGIPSALLNSTLSQKAQGNVIDKARSGEYRLLYLSPERLAREDSIEWLQGVPILFFAIDEAHCISEWGHEFRPEYRQLNRLRVHFGNHPIAAFTASATQRVRHDIIRQLELCDPHKYIASFHRPNLRYVVRDCSGQDQMALLVQALQRYKNENVIVYVPTIARVESTVDVLQDNGIAAIAYHGQMSATERRRNQEHWMADEVRVMVGTIAFGLGINKAAVRAVIHLSLPKSIEQYYQEAGRGGRDGFPADCVLLWQKRDAGLLAHFIEQIEDAQERQRAWQRYREIRGFVESKVCRHLRICMHFGETPKWSTCDACDVCGSEPEWLSEEAEAKTPKRKRARPAAAVPAASPVQRTAPRPQVAQPARQPAVNLDPGLREFLREWRKQTATQQNVPVYVVMLDTTLDAICQLQPATRRELLQLPGIGERKAELYGQQILDALKKFHGGARATLKSEKTLKPADETIALIEEGKSLDEIAQIRGRRRSTIISMVSDLVERGLIEYRTAWVDRERQAQIEEVCASVGLEKYGAIKDRLPPEFTYDEIRLVVAFLRRNGGRQSMTATP
jgi:ATP-dependent DNA helicase RecQ